MKKNYHNTLFIIAFILFSSAITYIGNDYKSLREKETVDSTFQQISQNSYKQIETLISEKQNATMAMAIALAQNPEIKASIINKTNPKELLLHLSEIMRQETDFKNAWVQLFDQNGYSLARSWDKRSGDNMTNIRSDVKAMLSSPKIRSTISIGKYDMSIKSMIPIFDYTQTESVFIGFLEVITHFNSIAQNLKKSGFDAVILVKPDATKKLVHAWTNLFIGERYVANLNANKSLMSAIEKQGFSAFVSENKPYIIDSNSGHLVISYQLFDDNKHAIADFLLFKPLHTIKFDNIAQLKTNINLTMLLVIVISGFLLLLITKKQFRVSSIKRSNTQYMVLFGSVFIIISIFDALFFYWKFEDSKAEYLLAHNSEIKRDYNIFDQKYQAIAKVFLQNVIDKPEILKIMQQAYGSPQQKENARQALHQSLSNDYENLKQYDIRQLHFHLNNNESFLRFHRPEKFGDNLSDVRETVQWVNQYKTPMHGFEEGRIFNGFRNVFPLILNTHREKNRHLGSVEISYSAHAFATQFAKFHELKTNFLIKEQLIKQKLFSSELNNYQTSWLPNFKNEKNIESMLKQENIYADLKQLPTEESKSIVTQIDNGEFFSVESTDHSQLFTFMPIKNPISNKVVATLVFETTNHVLKQKLTLFLGLFLVSIAVLFLLTLFAYKEFITRKTFETLSKKNQSILDSQNSIVVITNGTDIIEANQAFLNFFKKDNLASFKADYRCICHLFEADDRFFHLGKIKVNDNWVDELNKLDDKDRMVILKDQHKLPHIMLATMNQFDSNYIISFSDITDTMSEQFLLKDKSIHDSLTHAYNREYLNEIVPLKVKRVANHNLYLGVALLDIDHFKKVNDTFGHNTGDQVLRSLVEIIDQNIREHDVLIRWGGEEFIILFEVPNKAVLKTIVNQIRLKVEQETFTEVGHLTCSFGFTTYQDNEAFSETIARADKALYHVKENGRNAALYAD